MILKVTTIGNSVGVILPKEILERLRVGRGDNLCVVKTKNGILLTACDLAFPNQPLLTGSQHLAELSDFTKASLRSF